MNLLLPYAYDNDNKLVHINNAHKGARYTCPTCDAELLLRISKIPEGKKNHRRNHFAHKSSSENHCSESFLHKLFKYKCSELIKNKINDKQSLHFVWQCIRCNKKRTENLLNNVAGIALEYDLGVCKPDIALFDNNGKVITVLEVVVSHKTDPNTLQYYKDNKITCLQIRICCFEECEDIENVLNQSEKITVYPSQLCEECSRKNNDTYNENPLKRNTKPKITFGNNKDEIIYTLETKGNKICPECGGRMHLQETWNGEPILRCENHPRCAYNQRVDSILWSRKF